MPVDFVIKAAKYKHQEGNLTSLNF